MKLSPSGYALVLALLIPGTPAVSASEPAAGTSPSVLRPHLHHPSAQLSSAYVRMLQDEIAGGRVLSPEIVRKWKLDVSDGEGFVEAEADVGAPRRFGLQRTMVVGLAPDVEANNKVGDVTCAGGCGNRPLGQAETTIASLGMNLLAGWNDTKGFCTGGAVQGFAYSTDMGASWTDVGDVPALPTGGRYRGDPVHAVNRSTGDFYILGLYEGGAAGSGMALVRGHFAGGAFVVDLNTQILAGGADFIDKPWIAADPLTGNLYVSYSRFVGGSVSQIEVIRSTTNGASWDPPIVLNAPPANGLVQGSRPAVGPDGEVYVVWYEGGFPQSFMRIRRSNDFGLSYGAEATVTGFFENFQSGAPGFRRGFGINLPGIAVDNSNGPHRGRAYVSWTESVNYTDVDLTLDSPKNEVEVNGNFANATPFTVGDVLRGTVSSGADLDVFRFSGTQGQTLFLSCDSVSAAVTTLGIRVVCSADTASTSTMRFLAFDLASNPSLVFTLPATGTYYLRLTPSAAATEDYRILTGWDTPSPGERARDHRDVFAAYSDDGAGWSSPVRINDDSPWFDNEFAEISVDGVGRAHCYWHDFRDDLGCGALSYEYLTSSGDGGATWGANRRLSDEQSFWSFNACGSANQGDYQGITSEGSIVYPCWADSRLGDPDVWTEKAVFSTSRTCPAPASGDAGTNVSVNFTLTNTGNVSGNFGWSVTDANGWLTGAVPAANGSVGLAPGADQVVQATFHRDPDCQPTAVDLVRFITNDLDIPGLYDTCSTTVSCNAVTAVLPQPAAGFALALPRPNPASSTTELSYSVPRAGPVRLTVYGAAGTRVRTLLDGETFAGPHRAVWDGRDEQGRLVSAGIYFVQLDVGEKRLRRALTLLR